MGSTKSKLYWRVGSRPIGLSFGDGPFVLSQDTCYAESPIYGVGAWQAADNGWRIMVQGTKILSFEGAAPLENPACVPQ
ncbi:hypothetical protein [Aestuariivirga sp.]|uniref:hypothetical protein n=1 Tax=Aestuariivirga sp. TaxID=2650926 RepID=UPI00391A5FD3